MKFHKFCILEHDTLRHSPQSVVTFFEGVKVIGVETVKFEYNKGSRSQPINDEKSDYTVESNRGHHWIIGLRYHYKRLKPLPNSMVLTIETSTFGFTLNSKTILFKLAQSALCV